MNFQPTKDYSLINVFPSRLKKNLLTISRIVLAVPQISSLRMNSSASTMEVWKRKRDSSSFRRGEKMNKNLRTWGKKWVCLLPPPLIYHGNN